MRKGESDKMPKYTRADFILNLRQDVKNMDIPTLESGLRTHFRDEDAWNTFADELNRRRKALRLAKERH